MCVCVRVSEGKRDRRRRMGEGEGGIDRFCRAQHFCAITLSPSQSVIHDQRGFGCRAEFRKGGGKKERREVWDGKMGKAQRGQRDGGRETEEPWQTLMLGGQFESWQRL